MSHQQITYEEIQSNQKSIENATTSQTNVILRIQALRRNIQEDRDQFLLQLQDEITNAKKRAPKGNKRNIQWNTLRSHSSGFGNTEKGSCTVYKGAARIDRLEPIRT